MFRLEEFGGVAPRSRYGLELLLGGWRCRREQSNKVSASICTRRQASSTLLFAVIDGPRSPDLWVCTSTVVAAFQRLQVGDLSEGHCMKKNIEPGLQGRDLSRLFLWRFESLLRRRRSISPPQPSSRSGYSGPTTLLTAHIHKYIRGT